MNNTLADAMQIMNHAYDYAHRMVSRDAGHGETLALYDTTHETCTNYAMWVLENYPGGDCNHPTHFWNWLDSQN